MGDGKQRGRSTEEATQLLLWHAGPVADPSGTGRVALALHGVRPTGILFQSTVKMPPRPCGGKHSDNLCGTLPLLKNAGCVLFFLAGCESHSGEVRQRMCPVKTRWQFTKDDMNLLNNTKHTYQSCQCLCASAQNGQITDVCSVNQKFLSGKLWFSFEFFLFNDVSGTKCSLLQVFFFALHFSETTCQSHTAARAVMFLFFLFMQMKSLLMLTTRYSAAKS